MASGQDDETDKSHEPTQHKLDEARKKGELARSADLNTAAAYGGFLLAALTAGSVSIQNVSTPLVVLLDQPEKLVHLFFEGSAMAPVGGLLGAVALGLVAWFTIPAAMALLSVLAQRSFVAAPSKIAPKASRINPV